MLFPSFEEVQKLSEAYSTIPVFWEIASDHWSPLQIFAALSQDSENAFLLESISTPKAWQAWSYIGNAPNLSIRVTNGKSEITAFGSTSAVDCSGTLKLVQEILEARKSPQFAQLPEFTGGFAGFCTQHDADLGGLSCEIHLYDEIVAYNHLKSTAVIMLNLHKGAELSAQYHAAEIRAAELAAKIEAFRLKPQYRDDEPPLTVQQGAHGTFSVTHAPNSFELYRRMRSCFPAPYLCYIKQGDRQLAASSEVLTDELHQIGTIAGFWSNNGIRRTCRTEQAVHFQNTWDSRASVECCNAEDVQTILMLMESAKAEARTE